MEKLIIVIGTGRCALNSFAHLLSLQNNTNSSWQMGNNPVVNWYYNDEDYELIKELFIRRNAKIVADASHYLLNYTEKLYLEFKDICDVKVVMLHRNYIEVIASYRAFLEKLIEKEECRNLWKEQDRVSLLSMPNSNYIWNLYKTFPKYKYADYIVEALGYYWDYYDKKITSLHYDYPEDFRIVDVRDLNDIEITRNQILKTFLGYENPIYKHFMKDNPNIYGG